jgi:CheY-like chemotaxis protein
MLQTVPPSVRKSQLRPCRTTDFRIKKKKEMIADVQTPNHGKRMILIVDDFDDTRLLLRTWLEKKGYRVFEAANGNEAVARAETIGPDLIIMDVEMPELDGLSATRKIRQLRNPAELPIVAVSAYGADQFRADALAAGCNEYVSTPFEPDELENLIRSLVG